jgi:hypothetical protein
MGFQFKQSDQAIDQVRNLTRRNLFHIAEIGNVAGGGFAVEANRLADDQILIALVPAPMPC